MSAVPTNTHPTRDRPLHVAHVITTLGRGGAEIQLLRLVRRLAAGPYRFSIFGLTGEDRLSAEFKALGAEVHVLGMDRGRPSLGSLGALTRIFRESQPDLVQTWLYHADLMGTIAARRAGKPVVWTLQSGPFADAQLSATGRISRRILRQRSAKWPAKIICSSQHTMRYHQSLGYAAAGMTFIPNGADTIEFAPDLERRKATRAQFGIADEAVLIGMSARFDPQKDYQNFTRAAGLVHQQRPDVRFLACGYDVTPENSQLAQWVAESGAGEAMHLVGLQSDIAAIDGMVDIGCLSSAFGETFPLAISETMACAVPCAVTDVGDLAYMVGPTGTVAPPKDPEALAAGLLELIDLSPEERRARGRAARERVLELFSIDVTATGYEAVWREAVGAA